jgi:hypothetical protein
MHITHTWHHCNELCFKGNPLCQLPTGGTYKGRSSVPGWGQQQAEYNHENTTTKCKQFPQKKCKHQLQNLRDKCISFCAFPILHPLIMPYRLFTGQFGVKATQTNRKSLESRQRIAVIHCEHVLRYLTKLQDDLVLVWWNRL